MTSPISVSDFEKICELYETSVHGFQKSAKILGFAGSTAYDHKDDPCYGGRYARAHEAKMFWLLEEMYTLQNTEPPTVDGKVDNGWVTWRKNQVDLIKWTLSKLYPKNFGDKVEQTNTNINIDVSKKADEIIDKLGGDEAARELLARLVQ